MDKKFSYVSIQIYLCMKSKNEYVNKRNTKIQLDIHCLFHRDLKNLYYSDFH